MKALLLLCACVQGLGTVAQPGFDRNYCGFAPNDSIDLTNDGTPDLVVQGFRSGTDDEPSSSGSCRLHVMNLPGTTVLSDLDGQGYRRIKVSAEGDSIKPLDTSRRDDLYIPRLSYADGSIQVAYWGYGGNAEQFTVAPNLKDQHYVFRTVANGRSWHGYFAIEPPLRMDQVKVSVGMVVPMDRAFVVQ